MIKEKIYFTIEIYERRELLFTIKKEEFEFGRVVSGSLPFRDAIEAMKVVEIGNWEHYKILRHDNSHMFGVPVVVSMELRDWEAEKKAEYERTKKNKELRAELIARLPAEHVIYESMIGGDYRAKILLTMTTEYRPSNSSQIKYFNLACLTVYKHETIVNQKEIHLWDYETRDRKMKRKRWAEDIGYYLPDDAEQLQAGMKLCLREILDARNEVEKLYKRVANNTLCSRPFGSDKEWTIVAEMPAWIKKQFNEEAMETLARTGLVAWTQGECQLEFKLGY